jgi:hypothetical protein
MFQVHPEFEQPGNSAILWRYVDLARYADLLLKKQLFFSRADRFEDPFEGKINKTSINQSSTDINKTERVKRQNEKRTEITISSWHQNDSESYAMWKIYAKGSYGIALQTTFANLKRSFDDTDKPIYIGKINYYDESAEPIYVESNSFIPFLRKRIIYQYENEVRCCYALLQYAEKFEWQQQDPYDGVFIDVNLNTMIERVYISPYSPDWIGDIVKGLNKKFQFEKEVVHSKVFESDEFF